MNYIKLHPMQCFKNCYKAAVPQSTEVPVTKTDVAATEQKTMVYLNRKCQKLSQNVILDVTPREKRQPWEAWWNGVSLYQHIHSINLGSNPIDHLTLWRIALRYITALCSFKCLYLKHNSVWTLIMQTYVIPLIFVWLRSNGELLKETCLYFIIRINILIACYISYTIEPFKSTILKS